MKTWIIKISSAVSLFGFVLTGCVEHRHYERGHDDRGRYHHRHHHHDHSPYNNY